MGTMGETTSRSLAGAIRGNLAGGGVGGGGSGGGAKGTYVGGYAGGLGGSWGRAARPTSAVDGSGGGGGGEKGRTRPASYGAKNLWDENPAALPPTSPARTRGGRPGSASARRPPANSGARYGGGGGGSGNAPFASAPFAASRRGRPPLGSTKPPTCPRPPPPPPVAPAALRPLNNEARPLAPPLDDDNDPTSAHVNGDPRLRLRDRVATDPADCTHLHLQQLEEEIREALHSGRRVYQDERALLLKRFREHDDDGDGRVVPAELVEICAALGVPASETEAKALFAFRGHPGSSMPFVELRRVLLASPLRQLIEAANVRRGAFVAGESADFRGKIIYPPCRTGVHTPTDWDPALAVRSATIPDARLRLEHVYGYDGVTSTSRNVFYTADGDVVYSTAGLCVVYARPRADGTGHRQRFFLGHDDDVLALTLLEAEVTVRGVTYPARTLCASGQVSSHDHGPIVFVWDTRIGSQDGENVIARLEFGKGARGIQALGFSPDGAHLACVSTDNQHTVFVYDWVRGRIVSEGGGYSGEPPQVFGLEWDPYGSGVFATFGRKHMRIWSPGAKGRWEAQTASFGKAPMSNVHSIVFLPKVNPDSPQFLVAGTSSGSLYVYKGARCVKEILAHAKGPKVHLPDGSVARRGVRGLGLAEVEAGGVPGGEPRLALVSGGADGVVMFWDVTTGPPRDGQLARPSIRLRCPHGGEGPPPSIRAIAIDPTEGSSQFLVGTSGCDVIEVTMGDEPEPRQETLMDGHDADLWAVATHPTLPDVFVSVCDNGGALVWDAGVRRVSYSVELGFAGRCAAFSPVPIPDSTVHHLAIGGRKGEIVVLEVDVAAGLLRPVFEARDQKAPITCVRFSPDGRLLAAGGHDRCVDVYSMDGTKFRRQARCAGHSSTVTAVDFSSDGSALQTTSQSYEIVYFDPSTGRQVIMPQVDTRWATWTLPLGFPVMGIWPADSDGTDVNAVARTADGRFLATAGDDGFVSLFNFPCVVDEAACRSYRGHSSHVMGLAFSAGDQRLVSAGGKDRTVFQFTLDRPPVPPPPPAEPRRVWGSIPGTSRFGWREETAEDVAEGVAEEASTAITSSAPGRELPPLPPAPASQRYDDDAAYVGAGVEEGGLRGEHVAAENEFEGDDDGGW